MEQFKKYGGFLTGIFCLLLSVLYFKGSFIQTSRLMTAKYGPDFMPKIYSLALCLLSLALIFQEAKGLNRQEQKTAGKEEKRSEARVALTMGLILLYIVLLKQIGFLIASAFYAALQMIVIQSPKTSKKKYIQYIIFGIAVAAVLTYLFTKVFSVALPAGKLGF
ncbi:MAG: tripartite tricarboxylate transporter TctB family protein [Lachnospiraceae bacterium]|nr:tripartite tricarboxylate transporter TctB family protein [Lachnospiraceae bacterium]